MKVTILGSPYEVQVQYHYLNNITYVLLDAPVFRGQTKTEPYVSRSSYGLLFIRILNSL
jgi:alpha-1,3-glucan synthase